MRIIAGSLKGRRINPPQNLPVRPTTDMARESLFNILNNYVDYDESTVLDLFAGTGAIGFEFISRGAKSVTSIDVNPQCTDFIKSTIAELKIGNMRVVRTDVFDMLKRTTQKFDIVFADPPYASPDLPKLPDLIFEKEMVNSDGIFILEHPREYQFEEHRYFWQHRVYGKVNFTFFSPDIEKEENR